VQLDLSQMASINQQNDDLRAFDAQLRAIGALM
jgi:hypothetical protein